MKKSHLLIGLFAFTGIVYNSWPLGYLLDNSTARYGLASDLESPHHPYSWVFVSGDVITGVMLIFLCAFLYSQKKHLLIKMKAIWWSGVCFGLILFGFFTGFGAAAPDKCPRLPQMQHHGLPADVCLKVNGRNLSIDGVETSLAALGFFIAIFCTAMLSLHLSRKFKIVNWVGFSMWFLSGTWLTVGIIWNFNIHFPQQLYLILCGVSLVVMGVTYAYSLKGFTHQRIRLRIEA